MRPFRNGAGADMARRPRFRGLPSEPAMKPRQALSPLTARLAAAGLALALGAYLAATEGEVTNIHALAVTGALAAALAALTRRPLLAVVAVGAASVLILATAHVKRLRSDFILHAWDLFDVAQWGLPVDWIAREKDRKSVV